MTEKKLSIRQRLHRAVFPKEQLDDTPIVIPGMSKPLTLREEMRRYIREELSTAISENNLEAGTFEDEDDFEIEDDDSMDTPYTVQEFVHTEDPYSLEGDPETPDIEENLDENQPPVDYPKGDIDTPDEVSV